MYAAPILLVAGIAQDSTALHEAAETLGSPDTQLLERAANNGLADPVLYEMARQVVDIAMRACRRMSGGCTSVHIDQAAEYFDRFTLQRRAPGDEAEHLMTVATAA
jgi:hypothetical protein